jgi:predicted DNA-binding WGR domain protein
MRRFELSAGTSRKFWEVEVEGSELTVRFGRIGTNGQTQTKTFVSNAKAVAEEAKLIKEKTGKGYREVSATAQAPTPHAIPKPRPAPQSPPPATEPEAAQPEPLVVAPTPAPAIEWPSGGFLWDNSLRKQLPVVRGIHVPEFKPPSDPLKEIPSFVNKGNHPHINAWMQQQWTDFTQAIGLPGLTRWTVADALEKLKPDLLRGDDPDYWHELMVQCAARANHHQPDHLMWAARAALALHSPAFATGLLLWLAQTSNGRNHSYVRRNAYEFLRHALAAAPEADYLAARQAAGDFRGRTLELDCVVSYLFPEMREWAEECVAQPGSGDTGWWWLDQTVMSVEMACRHHRKQCVSAYYTPPAALLQVHLHGEAAFPFLEMLVDKASGKDDTVKFVKLLLRMRIPALIPALISRFDNKEVRAALDDVAGEWPAATLKAAVEHAAARHDRGLEGWAARLALRFPECVAPALTACTAAERERFQGLLAGLAQPEEAPAEALPELLRNPPWTLKRRPEPLPSLALAPLEQVAEILWPEGLKAAWLDYEAPPWIAHQLGQLQQKTPDLTPEIYCLNRLPIRFNAYAKVLAGEPLSSGDLIKKNHYYESPALLLMLPDLAAITIWNGLPPNIWYDWNKSSLPALVARHELKALPGFLAYAAARPEEGLALALPFRCAEFAPLAAHALKNLKKARPNAVAWLRAHPETAVTALIPPAFGADRQPRDNAQYALRWLAQNGFETMVRETAARYGDAAAEAVERLLGADPALIVPAKLPKLPGFFVPAAFRRPVLVDGGALPLGAVEHLARMLTISKLDEPYAGLDIVKNACTPDSLAEFAWDGFEAWLGAGAPSKEGWAYTALGLLGDDETARRLAPKIREWPGESAHARAVAGLDVLAAIGSDVALMHLNGIAQKVKFKGLQDKAREKIAQVADTRGFTAEELADRLVPDLGLDGSGTLELDFGPRKFYVAFDETLKPYVQDEAGTRLKDLPKPNKGDDAERAGAAVERYKALKKDAKAIASLQIVRLEQAMCARRRWTGADFRLFFLDHPVMRHLARRLVWGVYRDGQLTDAFRVAEDLTLADRHDDFYELPEGVAVGLAHVLELPEDLRHGFGQVFGDYEILQPFKQLGRETYAPTDEERRTGVIERFKGKKVATGSVMGLINKGWERGEAQDAGWVGEFVKRLPGGLEAELQLDPGTVVGEISYEPEQTIPGIVVRRPGTWGKDGLADFAGLDPIVVSEIIRDADLLAALAK